MKYLLDEEELAVYQGLAQLEVDRQRADLETAIRILRQVVVPDCIHTQGNERYYCDACPLSSLNLGAESLVGGSRKLARAVCDLPHNYSK